MGRLRHGARGQQRGARLHGPDEDVLSNEVQLDEIFSLNIGADSCDFIISNIKE